jgi:hypothetical protein
MQSWPYLRLNVKKYLLKKAENLHPLIKIPIGKLVTVKHNLDLHQHRSKITQRFKLMMQPVTKIQMEQFEKNDCDRDIASIF